MILIIGSAINNVLLRYIIVMVSQEFITFAFVATFIIGLVIGILIIALLVKWLLR